MARGAHEWRGVHGSATLRTARLSAAPAVARAESLEPGEMCRVPVDGELLGAARVRGRFAPLPLDAFDRAGGVLEPEEQGAYFQLLRLSFGEGRNFCRAAKKDLMTRLGASERRLHRILDGLVQKRFLRLLHRDNRGTLYRVFLPREAFGEPLGDDVLLGRAPANEAVQRAALGAEPAPPVPLRLRPRPPRPGGAAARLGPALAAARGDEGTDAVAAASDEIEELLAEGASPRQVEAAIRALVRRRTAQPEGGSP